MAVASTVTKQRPSTGHFAALVGGVACFMVVGLGAVVPLTLNVRTPHGTVTWDCGSRVSARHYTLAQTSQLLGDTRPLTFANGTISPGQAAALDKSSLDANCSQDLGAEWALGAVFVGVAGLILIGVGFVRVGWWWRVIPLLIAVGLVAWGLPLLFADVFRWYATWGLAGNDRS
jgi:hypothetical protein